MLVIDANTLKPIDLLDFINKIPCKFLKALYIQDVMWVDSPFH